MPIKATVMDAVILKAQTDSTLLSLFGNPTTSGAKQVFFRAERQAPAASSIPCITF